jgi:hypothetical protein
MDIPSCWTLLQKMDSCKKRDCFDVEKEETWIKDMLEDRNSGQRKSKGLQNF